MIDEATQPCTRVPQHGDNFRAHMQANTPLDHSHRAPTVTRASAASAAIMPSNLSATDGMPEHFDMPGLTSVRRLKVTEKFFQILKKFFGGGQLSDNFRHCFATKRRFREASARPWPSV
jgi:hypothetical protein